MSILIEQDREQVLASASFQRRTDLDSVCLVNASLDRILDWSSLKQPMLVEFEHSPRDTKIEDGRAEIRTYFRFRALDSSESGRQALLVECTFQANYDIDPKYKPQERELTAFQSGNAIFNTWPYFREFVQTNVARMSLPVPPVPFLRLRPKVDNVAESMAPARKSRAIRRASHKK